MKPVLHGLAVGLFVTLNAWVVSAQPLPQSKMPQSTPLSQDCPVQISFDKPDALAPWRVINDGVMGGLSKGRITLEDGALIFAGNVNTNGGGFTSIRRSLPTDSFRSVDAVQLRIKSDRRDYRLTLRTSQTFQGRTISWQAPIPDNEPGRWTNVTVPFSALKPSVFGRSVPSEPFDKTDARELGIIIADGVDGPFRLNIQTIDCTSSQ